MWFEKCVQLTETWASLTRTFEHPESLELHVCPSRMSNCLEFVEDMSAICQFKELLRSYFYNILFREDFNNFYTKT